MSYTHKLIFYRTITPLHVGCGQEVGVVDLPVIRERSTGYPYIPGSGIRGSLRDEFESKGTTYFNDRDNKEFFKITKKLFGPEPEETGDENAYAGLLAIHDARLLFYPVRSDQAIFYWVTSPFALQRFQRDVEAFQLNGLNFYGTASLEKDIEQLTGGLKDQEFIGPLNETVHLEEFRFSPAANNTALLTSLNQLVKSIEPQLENRTMIVSNRSFFHFVNYATMVVQHNRLTAAKTVEGGALFSIESVPPEAIFYGMIGATKQRKPPEDSDKDAPIEPSAAINCVMQITGGATGLIHLGGKESIGMGLTRLAWKM